MMKKRALVFNLLEESGRGPQSAEISHPGGTPGLTSHLTATEAKSAQLFLKSQREKMSLREKGT